MMLISKNKSYFLKFLATLAISFLMIFLLLREPKDYLKADINFDNIKNNQVVTVSGLTRKDRQQLKLSYINRYESKDIGVFGNHQVMYMKSETFLDIGDFFNFWYANIGLTEVHQYLLYLEQIKKLPKKLILVQITTPNNDKGASIIDIRGELLNSIVNYNYYLHDNSFSFTEFLRWFWVYEIKEPFNYAFNYSTIYSRMKSFFSENQEIQKIYENRIITFSYECILNIKKSKKCPPYWRTKTAFMKDGSVFLYKNNQQVHLRPLIQSESKLQDVPVINLSNLDKKRIMKYIIAINKIAKRNDLDIVFFITPVFEKINHNTDVDKVMDEVVKNIPESIKFIDDRGKYFSESFFLEFDHPSDKYFKELKNKIIFLLEKE